MSETKQEPEPDFVKPRYEVAEDGKSIKCLVCGAVSRHPMDVQHRYCGRCHEFLDEPTDAANYFGVGVPGDLPGQGNGSIVVLAFARRLTRKGAVNLAAWLSVLADPEGKEFGRLVEEIKRT